MAGGGIAINLVDDGVPGEGDLGILVEPLLHDLGGAEAVAAVD
jgi:hypothetical protein